MAESKAGFILVLIGGILGVLFCLFTYVFSGIFGLFLGTFLQENETMISDFRNIYSLFNVGVVVLGIILIIFNIICIISSFFINKVETSKKGALISLIFGMLSFNPIIITGSIIGLVSINK